MQIIGAKYFTVYMNSVTEDENRNQKLIWLFNIGSNYKLYSSFEMEQVLICRPLKAVFVQHQISPWQKIGQEMQIRYDKRI